MKSEHIVFCKAINSVSMYILCTNTRYIDLKLKVFFNFSRLLFIVFFCYLVFSARHRKKYPSLTHTIFSILHIYVKFHNDYEYNKDVFFLDNTPLKIKFKELIFAYLSEC